ncbi:hypothetical protein [Candidatus Nanohalobium constans]|uniref:Uncharacterized protein n=1 Tax=Candidatus Nanohalobium constans TaxID=2565781 RepID=A0A5Q0UEJ7_9ARCH|nr:hypothetical protein [Candidatus Nanohalobium constans]QGA79993.1 hypothetical protein LC1Nh_0085 [Candidatus Nanohalobium constans]
MAEPPEQITEIYSNWEDAKANIEDSDVFLEERKDRIEDQELSKIKEDLDRVKNWVDTGKIEEIGQYDEIQQSLAGINHAVAKLKQNVTKKNMFELNQAGIRLEKAIYQTLNDEEDYDESIDSLLQVLSTKEKRVSEKIREIERKKEDIDELEKKANRLLETSSNLVEGQASEEIGSIFNERKKDLRISVFTWLGASILSISALIVFSWHLYNQIDSMATGTIFIAKIALLIPVSVAVWFSVSNHSKQKKIMQEYEFKSNIALSMMAYREVLKEDLPDEKAGEFVKDAMDRIHENPLENQEQEKPPVTQSQVLTQLMAKINGNSSE